MQGRFKKDGNAAADPEPRGSTDRGADGSTRPTAPGGDESSGERPKAKGPTGPGPRIALRNWKISTRLVSLLALPVVAATTLGALRIQNSMDNIEQLDHMKLLTEMTQQATDLANALQEERDQSAGPLAGSGDDQDDQVIAPRQKADQALVAFTKATNEIDPVDPTVKGVQSTLVDIKKQLLKIQEIRDQAYKDRDYTSQTVVSYNELIISLLSLSQDMAQATSNRAMINQTRALATFSSAKEYASIQRASISAALAHPKKPKLSANDSRYTNTALDKEEQALRRFNQIRPGDSSELLDPLNGGNSDITGANKYALRVLRDPDSLASEDRTYMDWYDQDSIKLVAMSKIEQTLLTEMEQKARELRSEAKQDAFINGALILLVLGISLVGAFVVSRSMVRSLRRLQDTAQDVAQQRLPELVKELSEHDPQDVDTSVESVGVHSRDEIGKVAAAFDDVHREAVRLAAEQALLRGNVNAMFTNLSRRSQGLIQRQLSLISELESREADPDQLSSLFKLDHLATRMRRNGENLLVLAGEEPGRRWTRPVPLVDVLRAAASEVEQYERIELSSVPGTEVAGRVVNDLVHLLAELLENATSFSSPQTKVKVTGHALPDGRVLVEIHDTGIGLSPEDLAAINERLASPPTVDVSVSRRMGLFVVGRLSLRHGIRIQLRPSDSGGTTALVMLPVDVAQGGGKKTPPTSSGAPGSATPALGKPGAQAGGQASGPGGNGAAGLTATGPRRQVPAAGPRAELGNGSAPRRPAGGNTGGPAAPGGPSSGQPPRGGATSSGLPTRPVGASVPNNGAGGSAPSAGDFFGSGGSGNRASGGGNVPAATGDFFGGSRAGARNAANTGPEQDPGGDRPALPPRGGQDAAPAPDSGPTIAPPTGAPANAGRSGEAGSRRQLPQRGPAAELPGAPGPTAPESVADDARSADSESQRPGSSWGARRAAAADDWPTDRDARGHGEIDTTPTFPRGAAGGPGDTGEFSVPEHARGGARSGDTGEYEQPRGADTGGYARPNAGDTGEYAQPRGVGGGPGDTGAYALPSQRPGPSASDRGPGDTGQFALPAGPTGGLGDTGEYPRPSDTGAYHRPSDTGEYPRPGDTGAYGQPDTGRAGPGDTGSHPRPNDTGGYPRPNDTGAFVRPTGTGQFALPGAPAERPGDTGAYPRPSDTGEYARPSDTGEYARPSDTGEYPRPGDSGRYLRPTDSGAYAQPTDTGEYPRPSDTGGYAQPGAEDTGGYPRPDLDPATGSYAQPDTGRGGPGDTGSYQRPSDTGNYQRPSDTGEYAQPPFGRGGPGDTAQFERPDFNGPPPGRGGAHLPQGGPGVGLGGAPRAELSPAPEEDHLTGELPLPQGFDGGGTPIFDTIESRWFRSSQGPAPLGGPVQPTQADGSRAVDHSEPVRSTAAATAPLLPRRAPSQQEAAQGPDTGQQLRTSQASDGAGAAATSAADGAAAWRSSPNDERWRRAEQVREPAAGGVTSSGLPRRVPRANLVEGTAEEQPTQQGSGPQVSRAPSDVRGRLTNLRRGIQQGRQAGTDGRP
ncbi:nitrate- and nitrite sensing domain-containing protein [Streptomyces zagrosensis]|uniref:histidine kinase n=1 Tax=Streptomyces zagrosensis TaxID=1042984 RepID=A0A7W9Q977_9ACTN|nr:nitrate- and nitrite sensing domain-containing protein [Streptomyces zagrosensis]MBB5935950.1 signal transduction histidine kinase [Streptomyces zagrosensis]